MQNTYTSKIVDTTLVECDRPVQLHLVVYRPQDEGPYPLLVFNHGSCGYSVTPGGLKSYDTYPPIGDYFLSRGWMVVIPHRRGRGESDGVYAEGLDDSGEIYSLEPKTALVGAKRALVDLEAAMDQLLGWSDVDTSNVVLGGHSRGGILSLVYAGAHPDEIVGVLNFVGGWIGECPEALEINGELVRAGAAYPRESLWLYGGMDQFYSATHTQWLFDEYTHAGGRGRYISFEHADHDLLWSNCAWRERVEDYMAKAALPGFGRAG